MAVSNLIIIPCQCSTSNFVFTAALGPLLSGFAVAAKDWRWSLYESIWASSPVLLAIFFFLPETSTSNILLRRAQRLRKVTGNEKFMSQSEVDQRHLMVSTIVVDALIKPLEITIKDPAILFVQVYTAIVYGIYYSCEYLDAKAQALSNQQADHCPTSL